MFQKLVEKRRRSPSKALHSNDSDGEKMERCYEENMVDRGRELADVHSRRHVSVEENKKLCEVEFGRARELSQPPLSPLASPSVYRAASASSTRHRVRFRDEDGNEKKGGSSVASLLPGVTAHESISISVRQREEKVLKDGDEVAKLLANVRGTISKSLGSPATAVAIATAARSKKEENKMALHKATEVLSSVQSTLAQVSHPSNEAQVADAFASVIEERMIEPLALNLKRIAPEASNEQIQRVLKMYCLSRDRNGLLTGRSGFPKAVKALKIELSHNLRSKYTEKEMLVSSTELNKETNIEDKFAKVLEERRNKKKEKERKETAELLHQQEQEQRKMIQLKVTNLLDQLRLPKEIVHQIVHDENFLQAALAKLQLQDAAGLAQLIQGKVSILSSQRYGVNNVSVNPLSLLMGGSLSGDIGNSASGMFGMISSPSLLHKNLPSLPGLFNNQSLNRELPVAKKKEMKMNENVPTISKAKEVKIVSRLQSLDTQPQPLDTRPPDVIARDVRLRKRLAREAASVGNPFPITIETKTETERDTVVLPYPEAASTRVIRQKEEKGRRIAQAILDGTAENETEKEREKIHYNAWGQPLIDVEDKRLEKEKIESERKKKRKRKITAAEKEEESRLEIKDDASALLSDIRNSLPKEISEKQIQIQRERTKVAIARKEQLMQRHRSEDHHKTKRDGRERLSFWVRLHGIRSSDLDPRSENGKKFTKNNRKLKDEVEDILAIEAARVLPEIWMCHDVNNESCVLMKSISLLCKDTLHMLKMVIAGKTKWLPNNEKKGGQVTEAEVEDAVDALYDAPDELLLYMTAHFEKKAESNSGVLTRSSFLRYFNAHLFLNADGQVIEKESEENIKSEKIGEIYTVGKEIQYIVGQKVQYTATNDKKVIATIREKHVDDTGGLFFTLLLPNGREKQTVAERIEEIPEKEKSLKARREARRKRQASALHTLWGEIEDLAALSSPSLLNNNSDKEIEKLPKKKNDEESNFSVVKEPLKLSKNENDEENIFFPSKDHKTLNMIKKNKLKMDIRRGSGFAAVRVHRNELAIHDNDGKLHKEPLKKGDESCSLVLLEKRQIKELKKRQARYKEFCDQIHNGDNMANNIDVKNIDVENKILKSVERRMNQRMLQRYYNRRCPEKRDEVVSYLQKWKGKETKLFSLVENKYGRLKKRLKTVDTIIREYCAKLPPIVVKKALQERGIQRSRINETDDVLRVQLRKLLKKELNEERLGESLKKIIFGDY
eukprot:g1915.t1